MNEPIPPAPMTTAVSPAASRPRRVAWTAIAIGCASAAVSASSPYAPASTQIDAGARQ
jgi:hypothetical protein